MSRSTPLPAAMAAATMLLSIAACADRAHEVRPIARPSVAIPAGERIARRECAECHSIDGLAASPLREAPAFPVLRARLSRDELALRLRERSVEAHRRMPRLQLDDDELTYLLDYWEALEPAS